MIRRIVLRKLDSVEAQLGESVDYLRFVVRTSLRAFFKFAKILPLAQYRRVLPKDAYHVAVIASSLDADCGACAQIGINAASSAGVSSEVIRAVIEQRPDDLPADLADVYRFTLAVVRSTEEHDRLREPIRTRYGDEGLIELAFAMAACRVFPVTKRALGYATSCRGFRFRTPGS
jgi:alkylhydroperoxidase family enzyme